MVILPELVHAQYASCSIQDEVDVRIIADQIKGILCRIAAGRSRLNYKHDLTHVHGEDGSFGRHKDRWSIENDQAVIIAMGKLVHDVEHVFAAEKLSATGMRCPRRQDAESLDICPNEYIRKIHGLVHQDIDESQFRIDAEGPHDRRIRDITVDKQDPEILFQRDAHRDIEGAEAFSFPGKGTGYQHEVLPIGTISSVTVQEAALDEAKLFCCPISQVIRRNYPVFAE